MAPAQKRTLVLEFPLQGLESCTDEGRAREPDRICTQPVPALNPGAHFSALQTYSGRFTGVCWELVFGLGQQNLLVCYLDLSQTSKIIRPSFAGVKISSFRSFTFLSLYVVT